MPNCSICGILADKEDLYLVNGQDVCEECAISSFKGPQPCDVWAVKIATNTRKQLGQQGTEGLTERQKAIYNFLETNNGSTLQEILAEFKISEMDLRREFAVLRHCELAKAHKKDNQVIYVTWDYHI